MKLVITKKARKEWLRIPKSFRDKIGDKILKLQANPRGPQTKKLTDQPGYRLRVGDYRVLYIIDEPGERIVIAHIAHRSKAYEK